MVLGCVLARRVLEMCFQNSENLVEYLRFRGRAIKSCGILCWKWGPERWYFVCFVTGAHSVVPWRPLRSERAIIMMKIEGFPGARNTKIEKNRLSRNQWK